MIILAIRNPRGMNFIHPTRDLLLQALSKPVAFSSFHFIQIGSHYLTTLACRDPHYTYRISPLRSATTSPHVGRSFIQVSIDQFPFLVAPHFMGSCPKGLRGGRATCDLSLQVLSKPAAFTSSHFIQIGSYYLTTLACRDPHCTYIISPLRSATTSPHVGRSFIQFPIDQFPFLAFTFPFLQPVPSTVQPHLSSPQKACSRYLCSQVCCLYVHGSHQ